MDPVTVLSRREIDFTPSDTCSADACPEAPESVAAPQVAVPAQFAASEQAPAFSRSPGRTARGSELCVERLVELRRDSLYEAT